MNPCLQSFQEEVSLKYHLYNALFLTLPFSKTEETGSLLPIFNKFCQQEIKRGKSPKAIINAFFKQQLPQISEAEKINLLFRFLQFIERQVVLFDALEDAAFAKTHQMNGIGSIQNLLHRIINQDLQKKFAQQLNRYKIRIVLTAHPTQFYPVAILGILTQLQSALAEDQLKLISILLLQMGKTSFKYEHKPTPYEEAQSLVWYLTNIFYTVVPSIQHEIELATTTYKSQIKNYSSYIEIGFWPGGDRDGNPNVNAETTLAVAKLLKSRILSCYSDDLSSLISKLTFPGVLQNLINIRTKIQQTILNVQIGENYRKNPEIFHNAEELLGALAAVRKTLIIEHDSLFLEYLDIFITKIRCFGFYFASMDLRENAAIYRKTFKAIINNTSETICLDYENSEQDKLTVIKYLLKKPDFNKKNISKEDIIFNTIESFKTIKTIQEQNGEPGLCRLVISNCSKVWDILEVFAMLHLTCGFKDQIPVDIIPLFESIEDLSNAKNIMQSLFETDFYYAHLQQRQNTQIVMLGFSDGTKDGGYVAANWGIYQSKLQLTKLARAFNISIIFFDGRGGPPARGGGNTHAFYRSLGQNISHQQLQLTVQGQTISSNFGTLQSAKFNIEQLFTAGLEDRISSNKINDLSKTEMNLLEQLSELSFKAYSALKNDPLFVPYLEKMTPLQFFSELNIGSRPMTRKTSKTLDFSQLRAIPFVSSWSQLKQNIAGFYGFGYALKQLIRKGKLSQLQKFYRRSLFFRTLVENAMMSLSKSCFPLTVYMKQDKKFGKFWAKLEHEARETSKNLLVISQQKLLLENDPINRESIQLREEIVLPLLIIQQYAMIELNKTKNKKLKSVYKNMVLKALAANTNASRNSA